MRPSARRGIRAVAKNDVEVDLVADPALADYRKNIALVPQQIKVFNGTLADNIICGRTTVNIHELFDIIKSFKLDFFPAWFEQGLFTILGEDNRQLSGGEKQILGLIRALLEKPQVLIIDEGLNAIDIESESQIHNIIQIYAQNHLVLLISHNLKTILKAERINILDQGKIVQTGSAEELINNKGYFNHVWQIYRHRNGREKNFV